MRSPRLAELPPPPAGKAGWPWTDETPQLPDVMPDGREWPKISIVTPIYNQEEFIEETIRSVLLQGYPNYEHVIVNDGSTDGGLDVIEKYQPWVSCITQTNAGQSAALNNGFRIANGELISWQNSDDLYGANNFHHGALAAEANPDIHVFTGKTRVFWNSELHEPWTAEVCEEFSQESFLDRMCVMNQSMFFRKSVLDKVSVREEMVYAMDQQLIWDISYLGFNFKSVPEMIGYYRWHMKAKTNSNIFYGDREIFQMWRRLVREKRIPVTVRRAIQKRMWASLFSSFRRCRRNIPYKIAPELFSSIKA